MAKMPAALLLVLSLASCGSNTPASSAPAPGVLSGVVLGHTSGQSGGSPVPGTPVAVYRTAVPVGGPVLANPPKPVATTTTDDAGRFRFEGLASRRWFVVAPNVSGSGVWVRFDRATGASVILTVCTDCPIPL
jgi:hypothetical protein